MASRPRVLGIVMAGGKGERLFPLTKERSKPAVPFGGKYRVIDFVLSNFVQSGINSTYVLVQYMSQSLIEYLRVGWRASGLTRHQFITVVPPQMRLGDRWYRGTADAVLQNLNIIDDFDPDLIVVFGADHIYRIDISQMIDFHLRRGADATVAALPVPIKQASSFGVIDADAQDRMRGFEEKPARPKAMRGNPKMAYSSMGNYVFTRKALNEVLREMGKRDAELDFGKNIIPAMVRSHRVFTYDFARNVLPGIKPHEEKGYWRDIGTIEAFWNANMDLLGPKPRLDLDNRDWPINSGRYDGPPAKILGADIQDSIVGDGCVLERSAVRSSILGRGVHIEPGAVIEDSIVMDFTTVRAGARLKRSIVDRFNVIAPRARIGYDRERDSRLYHVDPSGLTVLARGVTRA